MPHQLAAGGAVLSLEGEQKKSVYHVKNTFHKQCCQHCVDLLRICIYLCPECYFCSLAVKFVFGEQHWSSIPTIILDLALKT
jgi:hypothetical protein